MNFESNKGKILTVNGLIDPEDLGFTLPHEHFYVDLRKNHPLPNDFTKEELDYCNAKLDLSNLAYARARAVAYASIQDQLDMQYWDEVNGTTTWKDHIAKVKSDNPKP